MCNFTKKDKKALEWYKNLSYYKLKILYKGGFLVQTEAKRKFLIDVAFLTVICVIIYFIFKFLSVYLLPFVIGIFVSFIVQKPVRFISSKTKIPKNITTDAGIIPQ